MQRFLIIACGGIVILVIGIVIYLQKPSSIQTQDSASNEVTGSPLNSTISPHTNNIQEQTVSIYFIALEDNGKSGKKIGCNDSLIPVKRTVSGTNVLQAALTELLHYNQQYFGESGLYNALYQSRLQVEDIQIEDAVATVKFIGEVSVGGVCDVPRFEEQIKSTILQFPMISQTEVFINNRPLKDFFSQ